MKVPPEVMKISMAVDRNIGICGVKFTSVNGNIFEKNWSQQSNSKIASMWEPEDVPSGQTILGVEASTANSNSDFQFITRLGWTIWEPSAH